MPQIENKSRWDKLPQEIENLIFKHRSAILIQNNAIKMFYNRYGTNWKENIKNYQDNFDAYCNRYGINDPQEDYYNYYYDYYKGSKYDFP
jgi:hypothetical protein